MSTRARLFLIHIRVDSIMGIGVCCVCAAAALKVEAHREKSYWDECRKCPWRSASRSNDRPAAHITMKAKTMDTNHGNTPFEAQGYDELYFEQMAYEKSRSDADAISHLYQYTPHLEALRSRMAEFGLVIVAIKPMDADAQRAAAVVIAKMGVQ